MKKFIGTNGMRIIAGTGTLASAMWVNNQITKIPGVTEKASQLENTIATTSTQKLQDLGLNQAAAQSVYDYGSWAIMLGMGVALIKTSFSGIKKNVRKQQARKIEEEGQPSIKKSDDSSIESKVIGPWYKRWAVGATKGTLNTGLYVAKKTAFPLAGVALLAATVPYMPQVYQFAAEGITNVYDKLAQNYTQLQAVYNVSQPTANIAKAALGLTSILGLQQLYAWGKRKKHGPILMRVEADRFNWVSRKISLRNFFRRRQVSLGTAWLTKVPKWLRTTNANTKFDVDVYTRNFPNGGYKPTQYVALSVKNEPHKKSKNEITVAHFNAVFDTLREYIGSQNLDPSIYGSNTHPILPEKYLGKIAVDAELHELMTSDKKYKLGQKDIDLILHTMTHPDFKSEADNLLELDAEKCALYANSTEKYYGKFERILEKRVGKEKRVVHLGVMMEYLKLTLDNSKTAFGEDFDRQGKILPAFRYQLKKGEGGSEEELSVEDFEGDDETGSMASNKIEQWQKDVVGIWNWGDIYNLAYNQETFEIDQDYFGSIPVIPGFSKHSFIRRKFYVKDSDGKTVAKLAETNVYNKLWGDNDWKIDIYDKEHVKDPALRNILTLFTQYLGNKKFYDSNMLKNVRQKNEDPLEAH